MKGICKRMISLLLCAGMLLTMTPTVAFAVNKTFTIENARSLSLANSKDIKKKSNAIILKEVKYVEAVDGIKAKIKNLRTFRWSPLLSFKFPQKLDLVNEYELNIKPLVLQTEIATLKHERDDLRYQIIADANKKYLTIYTLQQKIAYNEQRLEQNKTELSRNQARLVTGQASQTDVDDMQKKVDKLSTEIVNQKKTFELEKKDLTTMTGWDVTSGYSFANPMLQLNLPREQLQSIVDYTLANDQGFYVAKMNESVALMNLTSYESFMRQQYGGKMNYIDGFIQAAKNGQDVDYAAFMLKYKEMIKELDRPWNKSIRILFFKFDFEWFKGQIDGSRYIEDEMYAVYSACMEYAAAKRERESAEATLRKQVAKQYETLLNSWSAYNSIKKTTDESGVQMQKVTTLNRLGKADYTELRDARETYESQQLEAMDVLSNYNALLLDFDRLTCGAVTLYLSGADVSGKVGSQGDSFAKIDPIYDPYYYIYTTVDDLTFHIGVSIPEDFSPNISNFEVWNGTTQIGQRVSVTQEIRHLTIDYGGDSMLTIKLFDGSTFVDQCEIDATNPRDVLTLKGSSETKVGEKLLGSYEVRTAQTGSIETSSVTLKLRESVKIDSFTVSYEDNSVFSSQPQSVTKSFDYLTLLVTDLSKVQLTFYDSTGQKIGEGRFDTEAQAVYGTLY